MVRRINRIAQIIHKLFVVCSMMNIQSFTEYAIVDFVIIVWVLSLPFIRSHMLVTCFNLFVNEKIVIVFYLYMDYFCIVLCCIDFLNQAIWYEGSHHPKLAIYLIIVFCSISQLHSTVLGFS